MTAPTGAGPDGRGGSPAPAALIGELISCGRAMVEAGLVRGSGGNLSARLPGSDACWATASGTWLDRLSRSDFSLVDIASGDVLAGSPSPTSEIALHRASYLTRPDVSAIIHLHPQLSVLLDAMGVRIRLVTIDHAYYVREIRSTPFRVSGTQELAEAGAEALRDGCNCVILAHHGCSVVAGDIDLAMKRVLNLEEAAEATYRALCLGGSVPECPAEYLEHVTAAEAGHLAGTPR
jgi:ribulose-5-phosphate 4-epimerase/fuculose-1-phosphate aldolase